MDSHRRSKFADLRDPNVRAVKVHATTLHAFTPELEHFVRAGQAAAALRTLAVAAAADCICGHHLAEHEGDGCHHVYDPGRPGSAMCGCDAFVGGKRVP